MPQITLSKPAPGEHSVVQIADNTGVQCMFSVQQVAVSEKDGDLVFSFADGSTITVAGYYSTAALTTDMLPPITMNGEIVPAPPVPFASQEATEEPHAQQVPQQHADVAAEQATVKNPAQNSSATHAASQQVEGARFHDFDTSDLMDGINRLPGLDLPWGQKFYESHIRHGGWDDKASSSGDVITALPNDAPVLTVDSVGLAVTEGGVKGTVGVDSEGPNTSFAGESTVSGKLSATDPNGDSLTYGFLVNGQVVQTLTTPYGTVLMAADGTYTYTLNNNATATEKLGQDEHGQDSFVVAVSDGKGGVESETVTVDITGTNDKPELGLTNTDIKADGRLDGLVGNSLGADSDTDARLTYTLTDGKGNSVTSITTPYGTLTIDPNTGEYHFELNHSEAVKLNDGDAHIIKVPVTVTDEHGAHSTKDLDITIKGSDNYVPVVTVKDSGELSLVETGQDVTGAPQDTGAFTVLDYDGASTLTPTLCDANGNPLMGAVTDQNTGIITYTSVNGTLTITPSAPASDGSVTYTYSYTLNNTAGSAVDKLAAGEPLQEEYTIKVSDGTEDVNHNINIDITGSNDAPVLSVAGNTVREAGVQATNPDGPDGNNPFAGTPKVEGTLSATDVDNGDSLKYYLVDGDGKAVTSLTTQYGTISIDPQTGQYSYTLNNGNPDVDKLNVHESLNDAISIRVIDSKGAESDSTLNITVQGTNDKPMLTLNASSFEVTEGTTSSSTGNAASADSDSTDTHNYHLTTNPVGSTVLDSISQSINGKYGILTIDATTGKYTYTLYSSGPGYDAVSALHSGQKLTDEVFNIVVKDANGAFDIKSVNVKVDGVNSPPQFDTGNYALSVEEAGVDFNTNTDKLGTSTASGSVTVNGVDAGANLVYSLQNETGKDANGNSYLTTAYGTLTVNKLTGEYSYSLNNTSDALNTLQNGQNHADTFKIVVTNSNNGLTDSRDITVTINGSNDRPILEGTGQGADVVQGGAKSTSGTMQGLDPENAHKDLKYGLVDPINQIGDVEQTMQGKYGYLQLNYADGTWSYVLNQDISFLGEGAKADETFIVRVTDQYGAYTDKEITVNISGKDDAVTLHAATSNVQEDVGLAADGTISTTGKITFTDVDEGDTQSYTISGGPVTDMGNGISKVVGDHGYILFNTATGEYTYVMTDNANLQGKNVGDFVNDSFTVTITSGNGQGSSTSSTGNITITIEGTNDAPVLTVGQDGHLLVTNDAISNECVATGTLAATDVDDAHNSLLFRFMNEHTNPDGNTSSQPDQNDDGLYGSIAITPTGEYTYTLNLLNFQAIKAFYDQWAIDHPGEPYPDLTEKFTVTVTDPHGATDTKELVVSIPHDKIPFPPVGDGTRDDLIGSITAPIIIVTEDVTSPATGEITGSGHIVVTLTDGSSMSDHGYQYAFKLADGSYTQSISNEYGTLTVNPKTGEYVYTLNNASGFVQSLSGSYAEDFPFTVCVLDQYGREQGGPGGAEVNGSIQVTIKGANDAPLIDAAPALEISKDTTISVSQKAEGHDIDTGDTLTYSYSYTLNGVTTEVFAGGTLTTEYGTLTIAADGLTYTYELTAAGKLLLESLGQGSVKTETITLTLTDHAGAEVSKDITVTITGTNDAPTLSFASPDTTGNLAIGEDEKDGSGTAVVSVKGKAQGTDVNEGEQDSLRYSLTDAAGASSKGIVSGSYGTMTIDAESGEYTYMLNNDIAAVQTLGFGVSVTETFYVKVADHHGGYEYKSFTVTVTGQNDAPTLSISAQDSQLKIDENAADRVLHGTATGTDIDINADGSKDVDSLVYSFGMNGGIPILRHEGTYGIFEIDPATGKYTYTLKNTIDLDANATGTDSIQVIVTDSHGASSAGTDVNVTVQGKNDAPILTLTPEANLPTITEGDSAVQLGTATHTDEEPADTHSYGISITGNSSIQYIQDGATGEVKVESAYGTLTMHGDGTYSYEPNNNIGGFDAGESIEDTFTIYVKDQSGAVDKEDIIVNVEGSGVTITSAEAPPPSITFAALFNDTENLDTLLPTTAELPESAKTVFSLNITDMQDTLAYSWADSTMPSIAGSYAELHNDSGSESETMHPPVDTGADEQARQALVLAVLTEHGGV